MKASSLLCILCASLLLGSCQAPQDKEQRPDDRLTVAKVQGEIKVGMSGAAVIEVLGSPNILSTDDQRREVWVYDKVSTERMDASQSSYGTLLIVGGSSGSGTTTTRQRTLTIIIKFDAEKKVRDFAYNYTQF